MQSEVEGVVQSVTEEVEKGGEAEKVEKDDEGGDVRVNSKQVLLDSIRKQVEFYFSKQNLQNDGFLVSHMNAQMAVPVSVIAQFAKIKALTTDEALITQSVANSTLVTVTADGIKPNIRSERNTIILREIPSETPQERMAEIFTAEGMIAKPRSIRSDVGDTWFVTMESEDDAMKTILALRNTKFDGKFIKARLKSENILRSFFPVPTAADTQPVNPAVVYPLGGGGAGLVNGAAGLPNYGMNAMAGGMMNGQYGYVAQGRGMYGGSSGGGGRGIPNTYETRGMGQQRVVAMPNHAGRGYGMARSQGGQQAGQHAHVRQFQGQMQPQQLQQQQQQQQQQPPPPPPPQKQGHAPPLQLSQPAALSQQPPQIVTQQHSPSQPQQQHHSPYQHHQQQSPQLGGATAGRKRDHPRMPEKVEGGGAGGAARAPGKGEKAGKMKGKGDKRIGESGSAITNVTEGKPDAAAKKAAGAGAKLSGNGQDGRNLLSAANFPPLAGGSEGSNEAVEPLEPPKPIPVGFQHSFIRYSSDEILEVVRAMSKDEVGEGVPGTDLAKHCLIYEMQANTDLLLRQRSISIDDVREQLRKGRPVHREGIIPGAVDYGSYMYGEGHTEAPAKAASNNKAPLLKKNGGSGGGSAKGVQKSKKSEGKEEKGTHADGVEDRGKSRSQSNDSRGGKGRGGEEGTVAGVGAGAAGSAKPIGAYAAALLKVPAGKADPPKADPPKAGNKQQSKAASPSRGGDSGSRKGGGKPSSNGSGGSGEKVTGSSSGGKRGAPKQPPHTPESKSDERAASAPQAAQARPARGWEKPEVKKVVTNNKAVESKEVKPVGGDAEGAAIAAPITAAGAEGGGAETTAPAAREVGQVEKGKEKESAGEPPAGKTVFWGGRSFVDALKTATSGQPSSQPSAKTDASVDKAAT